MTIRIAMWSGPRNLSTAMMRSFGARPDTAVSDEPFYAAYLAASGADHPMRAETLASQANDWRDVVSHITGPAPDGQPIWYQKHMAHHMEPDFGLDWTGQFRQAFLIRDPAEVLASYAAKRVDVTLADIGAVRLLELFERESDRLGRPAPVVMGADIVADPAGKLAQLCAALDIPWTEAMSNWAPGRRETDGAWAPHWYGAVERSTGFERESTTREAPVLSEAHRRVDEAARPYFEKLAAHRI